MLRKFSYLLILFSAIFNTACTSGDEPGYITSRVDNGVVILGSDTAEDNVNIEQKSVIITTNSNKLRPIDADSIIDEMDLCQNRSDNSNYTNTADFKYAQQLDITAANNYLLKKLKNDDRQRVLAAAQNKANSNQLNNKNKNKNKNIKQTKQAAKFQSPQSAQPVSKISAVDLRSGQLKVIFDAYAGDFESFATDKQLEQFSRYVRSAVNNKPESQANLGDFYLDGVNGESYEELALSWYLIAASNGSSYAKYMLSVFYQQGIGVVQNLEESVYWYQSAEKNKNNSYAKLRVAQHYLSPTSAIYNQAEGAMWLELAANQNNTEAQLLLGDLYSKGTGVEKSEVTAIKWYGKAAANGSAYAQYSLGVMFYNGQGTEQNLLEAQKWLTYASFAGHTEAQFLLGRMYEQGFGVKKDLPTAYALLKLIPDENNHNSDNIVNDELNSKLHHLIKSMTPAERIMAEDLTKIFKKRVKIPAENNKKMA